MKAIILTLLLTASAFAHAPGEKLESGPNGGRLIIATDPRVEFFVNPDRKVQFTFVDAAGNPIAPAGQTITVTTGERSAPTKLTFTKTNTTLLADQPLPSGTAWPAVIQIKVTPDSKTITEKFTLDLATCSGCKKPEYACTCAH